MPITLLLAGTGSNERLRVLHAVAHDDPSVPLSSLSRSRHVEAKRKTIWVGGRVGVNVCVCARTCMHVRMCMRVCACACVCLCVHACVHQCSPDITRIVLASAGWNAEEHKGSSTSHLRRERRVQHERNHAERPKLRVTLGRAGDAVHQGRGVPLQMTRGEAPSGPLRPTMGER